jgi:hypothetical protein
MATWLVTLHTKALLSIQPVDTLPVDAPAIATQLNPDPRITPAHTQMRNLTDTPAKIRLVIRDALVAMA